MGGLRIGARPGIRRFGIRSVVAGLPQSLWACVGTTAARAEGLRFGFYYSLMDWHHPDYTPRRAWNDVAQGDPNFDRYAAYLKGQLKELLTGYGPHRIPQEFENFLTTALRSIGEKRS